MPPDVATTTSRVIAADLVGAVLRRKSALEDASAAHAGLATLPTRDRAFVRLLVVTVLRRLGQLDALIAQCLAEKLPHRAALIQDVLRLGLAQLLFLGTPPHAAVSTSVELADALGFPAHKGLVNAVLRRLARDGADLVAAQDAPLLNTSAWLWRSWCDAYGEATARAMALVHMEEPPLDLTVREDPETWRRALDAVLLPTGTLRRAGGGAIAAMPGYDEGAWWIQDAAAGLPALLLGDVAGRPVLDLCAAPGGKTAQLAARGARVTALDRSQRRIGRLKDNLARLSLRVETLVADVERWRPAEPASFILLDAPCTATGAIRRHPDVAHLKTRDDVVRLASLQERLLAAAIEMLGPGGVLVYCTCSLEPEEGEQQIARLLAAGAPMRRRPIAAAEIGGLAECVTGDGDLRTLPSHLAAYGGLDGFYAARLVRTG